MLVKLAVKSLFNRKTSVLLTLLSLVVSIGVLIGVEHIRHQAKDSFNRTLSGTDLIVGARSGQLNLLLYSVFRMGSPTNNIKWENYLLLKDNPLVKWTIPISLGDSHKGYRVMGTSSAYFEHYKYGRKQALTFRDGQPFSDMFETVLGFEVAQKLGYKVGDAIVIAHGIGKTSFTKHDKSPFKIVGILDPTGTPVDKTVHVTLGGIEAVHFNPRKLQQFLTLKEQGKPYPEVTPKSITATLVGLKSKLATFRLQRSVNEFEAEALTAILPGVALAELWQMLGSVENVLRVIAVLILISSLLGLATLLLASIRERKAEISVLRAIGAGPLTIFTLIITEALLIAMVATGLAVASITLLLSLSKEWLVENYGIFIEAHVLSEATAILALMVLGATALAACIPAIGAYRSALNTGLSGAK